MSMIPRYNQLVQAIFQTDKPGEVDVESIEQLSKQFPFFAPVQYLLSRKIKKTNPEQYRAQIAKTAIFFNNPHWLNDLLIKEEQEEQEELSENAIPEFEEGEPDSELPDGETEIKSDENAPQETNSVRDEVDVFQGDTNVIQNKVDVIQDETDAIQDEVDAVRDEKVDVVRDATVTIRGEVDAIQDEIDDLPVVPIEPLFAVDYFASQGIRLTEGDTKDKLSQKLRSFTEWLKTMKKIHPEKLEQEMDEKTSSSIQHIAEVSNTSDEIITETMAEVYAHQGLRNKAAEVYQKLSLLNPDKRTYFAAKISKLNEV